MIGKYTLFAIVSKKSLKPTYDCYKIILKSTDCKQTSPYRFSFYLDPIKGKVNFSFYKIFFFYL